MQMLTHSPFPTVGQGGESEKEKKKTLRDKAKKSLIIKTKLKTKNKITKPIIVMRGGREINKIQD